MVFFTFCFCGVVHTNKINYCCVDDGSVVVDFGFLGRAELSTDFR
jgi:hypothetical protein